MSARVTPAEAYVQKDGENNPLWFVPCPEGWVIDSWREAVEIWAASNGIDMLVPPIHHEEIKRAIARIPAPKNQREGL